MTGMDLFTESATPTERGCLQARCLGVFSHGRSGASLSRLARPFSVATTACFSLMSLRDALFSFHSHFTDVPNHAFGVLHEVALHGRCTDARHVGRTQSCLQFFGSDPDGAAVGINGA